jgi:hypothetical protein
MKFPFKTLGLLLTSLAVSSCGGGGSNGGAASPPLNGTITLTASKTSLPRNPNGVLPFPGSPYTAEVNFVYRNNNGQITALTSDATFTINQPSIVSISPPDDPSTTDINELQQRFVSFFDTTNNGTYTMFVTSYDVAGTATLTAAATDPSTGQTVSRTLNFTVAGAPPLPASVVVTPSPSTIYITGVAGGVTSSIISAQVFDGADQPVPDPGAADNVRFEIVGDAGGGRLSGNSGTGNSITAKTVAGIATVAFQSGTVLPPGPVQIRATVDRADNDVSNGIADPVSATNSVAVSDGKIQDLALSSPDLDAINANLVFAGVNEGGLDGTYSFTISALATDRSGNPPVAGTTIQFGLIDAPTTGFPGLGGGSFQIAGGDGNPQEGGNTFTAPNGQFTTAGGGAGPGDTLLVFGDLVDGNADLENVRTVQSVNSATNITVTSAFNRNDTTGVSVNYGNVLPYVIGRANEANITASATTNDAGVATTTLNYPVSRLGKQVIIWAQANIPTGGALKTRADIQPLRLPGVAPALLTVSPTPISGNTTTQVTACLVDAYNSPILGASIGFSFVGLGVGTGSIDGVSGSGVIGSATGANGCTTGTVTTAGISDTDSDAAINFTAGGDPVSVPIVVSTGLVLQAFPSAIGGGSGSVTLRLTDGSGNPVASAQLQGTCTGGPSIGAIAPTGANGQTIVSISAGALEPVCPGETRNMGTCTFRTAAAGGPTATVTVLGAVYGDTGFSPPPPPPPASCGP